MYWHHTSRALWLAAIGMLIAPAIAGWIDSASAQSDADRQLFAAYKRACGEVRQGTFEERVMVCQTLARNEDLVSKFVRDQVSTVCGNIDRECAASNNDARQRLTHFASVLQCPAGASVCTRSGTQQAKSCTQQPSPSGRDTFACPVAGGGVSRGPDQCAAEGGRVRSNRGSGHYHNALDINAAEGTNVLATKAGKVAVAAANWGAMGNVVIIDHEDGDYSVYGHLKSLAVQPGDCVTAGKLVGTVGYTGNATCLKDKGLTAHLHFAVIRAAKIGLADGSGPIAAAVKNGNDWIEISREFLGNDVLDVGVKDPEQLLKRSPACLR